MFLQIILIILGFVLLIFGANVLIKGCSEIAKKFHIPEMLIGLTIVALGTSAPELIVTITSASKGTGDLILGNAIGSNLCNLLLILGLMAILSPIKVDKEARKVHIPVSFFVTLLVVLMGLGLFYGEKGVINKLDGTILIILSIIYFIYPIIIEIKDIVEIYKKNKNNNKDNIKIWKSILFVVLGIVLLKYGGDFVVDYSIQIARMLSISERVIGLTIIAIGTALPELVTSIFAVIKKDTDLAVGNLVGSCIINLLLILGLGAVITPLKISNEFIQNLLILLGTNLLIWLFNFLGKKEYITRIKGCILMGIFALYITKLFI